MGYSSPSFAKRGLGGDLTTSTYPKPISPSFQYVLFQHSMRGYSDKTHRHDLRMFLYFQPQFLLRFLNNPQKSPGKLPLFFESLEKRLLLKSDPYKVVAILHGQKRDWKVIFHWFSVRPNLSTMAIVVCLQC